MPRKKKQESSDADSDLPFEEILKQLEETVETLESGDVTLEEATKLYEVGANLAKLCAKALSSTELRITELKKTSYENLTEMPWSDNE